MDSKVQLHPEAQCMVEYLEQQGKDRYQGATLTHIRNNHSLSSQVTAGDVNFHGTSTDILIPSPQVTAGLRARIYVPAGAPAEPTILVYFHGGGMVLGSIDTCQAACQHISMGAGVIVVSVEYRLAPEHQVPAQMDDGICATQWVLDHRQAVGGSAGSLVGVGGDSAGGTIAASVAHDVAGLSFQLLVYPHVTEARNTSVVPSQQKYKDGPLLTQALIDWFESHYMPAGMEKHPRVASVYRERFDHLPAALIVVAEIDPLRDEAEVYQDKLRAAGVTCEVFEVKGVLHAFFTQPGIYKSTAPLAYNKVSSFLRAFKQ